MAELRQRRGRLRAALQSDEDTVGDRGDAADEIQLADQVAAIDDRITELEGLLLGAEPSPAAAAGLPDGTEVTLKFPDNRVATMRVIAVVEELPPGQEVDTLTAGSPLGRALAGHAAGDTVTYETPQGQQRVELVAVKFPA